MIPIDSISRPCGGWRTTRGRARRPAHDYDKLTLDIETDGSVDPQAALRDAAEILISSLSIFTDEDRIEELRAAGGHDRAGQRRGRRERERHRGGRWPPERRADGRHPHRGARARRALVQLPQARGHPDGGDLVSKSEGELAAIPNFGKKSIDEVIETLNQRGLGLRND